MATIDPFTGKPRGRGRPRKYPISGPSSGYSGPSLDTILQMSDEQVIESYKSLGIEPRPLSWSDDDPEINVAHWAPMDRDIKSPVDMVKLRADADAHHAHCLKLTLMNEYVTKWVDSLDDAQLIQAVESLDNTTLSVSEKRYMKVADMRERVQQLVWPTLSEASKLYIWPTNPLTGQVEDGRNRIPRPHDG